MFDGKAFGEDMVTAVKAYVDRATAPLLVRIGDLEKQLADAADPVEVLDAAAIERMIAEAVAELPEPPAIDDAAIERAVGAAVARIPAPTNGVSVTVSDVAPMIAEEVAKAVSAIPVPQDGVGMAGTLIDRAGELVVTLSNGDVRKLGVVVGRDADPNATKQLVSEAVAQIPVPKDGQDALGFDDMQFEHDGERGFTLKFVRGDQVKTFEFRVPVTIYRGVWREGAHQKGDAVTWGGSLWIAQKDTDAKPDSGDGWQLAVKRGRDSREPTPR